MKINIKLNKLYININFFFSFLHFIKYFKNLFKNIDNFFHGMFALIFSYFLTMKLCLGLSNKKLLNMFIVCVQLMTRNVVTNLMSSQVLSGLDLTQSFYHLTFEFDWEILHRWSHNSMDLIYILMKLFGLKVALGWAKSILR